MKIRLEGFGSFYKWDPSCQGPHTLPDLKTGTVVMVRYRDGSEHLARYGYEMAEYSQWRWSKENSSADIVAFSLPNLVYFDSVAICQSGGDL